MTKVFFTVILPLMSIKYITEQIKEELAKRGWGYYELARQSGVEYNNIRSYLDGRTNKPQYAVVNPILKTLGLDDLPPVAPYYGTVNGGNPRILIDALEEERSHSQDSCNVIKHTMIRVPYHLNGGYVLMVVGDSMNQEILEGYFILVDPQVPDGRECDGEIVIACLDGYYTCKIYNHTLRQLEPRSTNSEHYPLMMRDYSEAKIIGIVRQIFKNRGI
jgi:transcriptional regulator with XRE-family HTH domain